MKKLAVKVKSLKAMDGSKLKRVVGGRCQSTNGAGSGKTCPISLGG